MNQCPRCQRWHHNTDTAICDECWIRLMVQPPIEGWDDIGSDYDPPIDTLFDRDLERERDR